MRLTLFLSMILLGFWVGPATADPLVKSADSAAARYIRTLFNATLQAPDDAAAPCADIAGIGRFAAGRAWRRLSSAERRLFDAGFCDLATEAVGRVKIAFPGMSLSIIGAETAAEGMTLVQSVVTRGEARWPIGWQVETHGGQSRLADLRILGISLGIFLRGLGALEGSGGQTVSLRAADLLHPWAKALDRALPAPSR